MKNQNLIGTWKFTRHIIDNMAGVERNATGELTITKTNGMKLGKMDGGDFFQSYTLNMEKIILLFHLMTGGYFTNWKT